MVRAFVLALLGVIPLMFFDTSTMAEMKYENIVTVAVCQLAAAHGEPEKNLANMEKWIKKAAQKGANFIIFPEGILTGIWGDLDYPKLAQSIPGPATDRISKYAKKYDAYIVFGLIEKNPENANKPYNSAALCHPNGKVDKYRKVQPWHVAAFTAGKDLPVFETKYGLVGMQICYDLYSFPEAARILALKGARLLIFPTSFPDVHGWEGSNVTRSTFLARVVENQYFIAISDQVGKEAGVTLLGKSMIVGPYPPALCHIYAGPASGTYEELVIATLDLGLVKKARHDFPWIADRNTDTYDLKALLTTPQALKDEYPGISPDR